jgi:tRNA(Ile)-lysidine synthetase-like protein
MAVTSLAPAMHDLNFAHVDTLSEQIQPAVSSGPHPLLDDVMWSVAGATADGPARLSLHRGNALPFSPTHPLLEIGQRLALPRIGMGEVARLDLADGWQVTVAQLGRDDLPPDWKRRDQPWRAFFDAATIGTPYVTTAVNGQQFAPLGMAGNHKMVGDFFTDHKIPVALRSRWPILIDSDDRILWVCGLQLAHHARMTEQTTAVCCITIEHNGDNK